MKKGKGKEKCEFLSFGETVGKWYAYDGTIHHKYEIFIHLGAAFSFNILGKLASGGQ